MNKMMFSITGVLLICFLSVGRADDFQWKPVLKAEWDAHPDSALGYRDAVMLFERVIADDEKLPQQKIYVTYYDRIRIFSSEGRKYGDVTIPYLDDRQDIEEVQGRTLLPDGKEFALAEKQIREEEVMKSDEVKIKQKSFSLPGVTDNCIVEYMIKLRLPSSNSVWRIQKNIPLVFGEYRWKFYRPTVIGGPGLDWRMEMIRGFLTPNYNWTNTNGTGSLELLPSADKAEEARFTIQNVNGMKVEPMMLPPECLRAQLLFYYGDDGAPDIYWNDMAFAAFKMLEKFFNDDDKLDPILERFASLQDADEKTCAAYRWAQHNLLNSSYADKSPNGEEFKDNTTVNDVLERGYGSAADINMVFFDMLKKMNIDPKFTYFVDRDERLFIRRVKDWQFHGTLVAVGNDPKSYRYFAPGMLYTSPGSVPRNAEGTTAFIVSAKGADFQILPFSSVDSNLIQRQYLLSLAPEGRSRGTLIERRYGQWGRVMRLFLHKLTEAEKIKKLQSQIVDRFDHAEVDSVQLAGVDSTEFPLTMRSAILFSGTIQAVGKRLLFQPYGGMAAHDNPFQAADRIHPILFDFPYVAKDEMSIHLPSGFKVEGLPTDTTFANNCGSCIRTCTITDSILSVKRIFRLTISSTHKEAYSEMQKLFRTLEAIDRTTIVLNHE